MYSMWAKPFLHVIHEKIQTWMSHFRNLPLVYIRGARMLWYFRLEMKPLWQDRNLSHITDPDWFTIQTVGRGFVNICLIWDWEINNSNLGWRPNPGLWVGGWVEIVKRIGRPASVPQLTIINPTFLGFTAYGENHSSFSLFFPSFPTLTTSTATNPKPSWNHVKKQRKVIAQKSIKSHHPRIHLTPPRVQNPRTISGVRRFLIGPPPVLFHIKHLSKSSVYTTQKKTPQNSLHISNCETPLYAPSSTSTPSHPHPPF